MKCMLNALVVFTLVGSGFAVPSAAADEKPARPNILCLTTEDISPHLGCYGYKGARTPNLDKLAGEGVRYERAFGVAAVCAVNRSCLISGMYPTTIGTQHMRCQARLPEHIRAYSAYLRDAGYYCTNNSKTDYNASYRGAWDESSNRAHWKNRRDDQPFFAVFNYTGTHESRITSASGEGSAPPQPEMPPYYPDTTAARRNWSKYYDVIAGHDGWVGEKLKELEDAGLADNTIVIYYSDHGAGLPRAKRWLYDSGMQVPLIIRIPERFRADGQGRPGTVDGQLVSFLDIPPTVIHLAGVPIPKHMQGRAFLGPNLTPPREYVYGARDRMDERYDIIRCVRDRRYKYIRNYQAWKPYYQYMNTPEKGAIMRELRRLHASGELTRIPSLFMADSKPVEELYDTEADPHEVHNLAGSATLEHTTALARLRKAHDAWVVDTLDLGLLPEPEIVAREKEVGNRYDILRGPGGEAVIQKCLAFWKLGQSKDSAPALAEGLSEKDAAARYWAAIGLGNLGKDAAAYADQLEKALGDESASVRIAAARALARTGKPEKAIPILTRELAEGEEWTQLNAAIELDEMDEAARPAIPALKAALKNGGNKYVVRVANRALNQLLKTDNVVP